MKKLLAIFSLILLLAACSNEEDKTSNDEKNNENKIVINLKSDDKQKEAMSNLTKDDYKEMYTQGWNQAKEWGIKDDNLKNQIALVTIAEQTMYETDLTKEQIITIAKKNVNVDETVKKFTLATYHITASEKDVEEYMAPVMEELNTESAQLQGYAQALNMEPAEYFFKYYKAQYESQMLTNAAINQLIKQNGLTEQEAVAKFMEGLNEFRSGYSENEVIIELKEAE